MKPANMTYAQKLRQANKEAKITVVALVVIVIAWCLLGFGLAGFDIQLFHTPLWVWGGTIGIWIVAVVVVAFLTRAVFVDFPLDADLAEEDGEEVDA